MRTDSLIVNAEDIGEIVGDFHGTPIRSFNPVMAEVRELNDAQQRVRYFLGSESVPVEVLPGELIHENLVRRETTAEVLGEEFYSAEIPTGIKQGTEITTLQLLARKLDGALITWRPGNQDFAIIHEEVADELPA